VNVVRVAVQALAAVLGGTQSLHTNGRDEALSLPTEASAVLALRTQQVLAHESGVADVIDPLGGSPYVEALTDEIERRAKEILAEIDALGGMLAAVEAGYPQRRIEASAYEAQRRIESGADVVVGLNRFTEGDAEPAGTFVIDSGMEARAVARVQAVRAQRDAARARASLADLDRDAAQDKNLFDAVLQAVEAGSTIGEILGVLEKRYGAFRS
jgi:methylmalonyl-CoA mutase N-terminal domain/subunit